MQPTPNTNERRDTKRRSFTLRPLPLDRTAGSSGRSQRELVQWSLMLCPERGKRRAR
jgi:hypothetical protein